jgi:hypothetical protein
MLALLIKQPWAELIVAGRKSIEVRRWWPRVQLPVPVAIHAGKTWDNNAPTALEVESVGLDAGNRCGGIIGVARLDGIGAFNRPVFEALAAEHLNRIEWYRDGLYGWSFSEPVRFQRLIPCRGMLGLFELPEIVAAEIAEAMTHA